MFRKQLVAVGDKQCGKTSLLVRIAKQTFSEEYNPTLFENYAAEVESSQGVVQVSMFDTPGDNNFSHLRPLSYPNSDVVLLCFDLSDTTSYRNLFHKWSPEVRKYCPYSTLYIVGCKKDLQPKTAEKGKADWRKTPPINKEEKERLLFATGTNAYFECSAKSGENVDDLLSHHFKSSGHIFQPTTRRRSLVHGPNKSIESSSKFRRHSITEIRMTRKTVMETNGMRTKKACSFL